MELCIWEKRQVKSINLVLINVFVVVLLIDNAITKHYCLYTMNKKLGTTPGYYVCLNPSILDRQKKE